MTKAWTIPSDLWAGETVAILGNAPTMTAELAESVRVHKTIAVNRAVKCAPWADMFVALDPEHHDGLAFAGLRVVGAECDVDALYAGMFYERVTLGQGNTIEIRNNLLAAIRIASAAGASKIILLGVDTENYERIHGEICGFTGLTVGLAALIAELTTRGVQVDYIAPAELIKARNIWEQ